MAIYFSRGGVGVGVGVGAVTPRVCTQILEQFHRTVWRRVWQKRLTKPGNGDVNKTVDWILDRQELLINKKKKKKQKKKKKKKKKKMMMTRRERKTPDLSSRLTDPLRRKSSASVSASMFTPTQFVWSQDDCSAKTETDRDADRRKLHRKGRGVGVGGRRCHRKYRECWGKGSGAGLRGDPGRPGGGGGEGCDCRIGQAHYSWRLTFGLARCRRPPHCLLPMTPSLSPSPSPPPPLLPPLLPASPCLLSLSLCVYLSVCLSLSIPRSTDVRVSLSAHLLRSHLLAYPLSLFRLAVTDRSLQSPSFTLQAWLLSF